MLPLCSLSVLLCLGLFLFPAGLSRAQTIAGALDTPSLTWTPSGTVAALNDPALSHDGVDAVRVDATTSNTTGGLYPSIKTTVAVPSVVEFWHRSRNLEAITTLGRNRRPVAVSSAWKKVRWLQLPANSMTSGELEIMNQGEIGSGPLYVDEVTVVSAAVVSLAEALDFPGLAVTSTSAVGLAESWLAPDGTDAVVFTDVGSVMDATLSGPRLIRFRHGGGDISPSVQVAGAAGSYAQGDTSWAWIPSPGTYRFSAAGPSSTPYAYNQKPLVMDSLETVPGVPLHEALDAPGLTFSATGITAGVGASSGAVDGDALLCLSQNPESSVSLAVVSPGIVQFSWLGNLTVRRNGQVIVGLGGTSATWQIASVPVYRSGETLSWETKANGLWLNAVSVLPHPLGPSIAELLNAPAVIPEFLVPAYFIQTDGSTADDSAAAIIPNTPTPFQPVLRLPFMGASFVSLRMTDTSKTALVRVDGGAWQTPNYSTAAPFRAIVTGSGPHSLEMTGPVVLDRFEVITLEAVPLAEALDAPTLTFSTSPEYSWSAYRVPPGLDTIGGHGAFGGSHVTAGDPWIETQVTGPGILRSTALAGAAGATPALTLALYPKLWIDGVLADPYFVQPEVLLGAGVHTARWVQKGSQVQDGSGTLASLDAVSFDPLLPLPLGVALETPNRTWSAGGAGDVIPIAWAAQSPDAVDSVHILTNPATNPSYLETMVNLPCRVNFRGKNIQVSTGGNSHFQLSSVVPTPSNLNGFGTLSDIIPGLGPALVRFSATSVTAVLDAVNFEPTGNRLSPTAILGDPSLTWSLYGGQAWQVVPNEATGLDQYRTTPNQKIWMETIVTGPGKLDVSNATISLPEHDNRLTDFGWIPYPGPQRVLVIVPANSLPGNTNFRTFPPIASWAGSPAVSWTTGGDVPWQTQSPQSVRSGRIWPGELSWIEAAVTGPGVFFYDFAKTGSNAFFYFTCDGIALPNGVGRGWLHLGTGEHRIRWEMANPRNGFINSTGLLVLNDVAFTPQPVDSVSAVLSSGALNFYEIPPVSYPPEVAAPVIWPAPSGWQVVDAPDLPGRAVRGSYNSGSLTAFLPAAGRITSLLKMEGATYPGASYSTISPASAAPFPWLPWTSDLTFSKGDGFQTFVAQCALTPDPAVTVAEALDQPDLTWVSGSNPPGLWQPLKSPYSLAADQDALHLMRAAMGDLAWLETTVTGPLRITTNFNGIGNLSPTGLRILMDDKLFVPDNPSSIETSPLQVPAGLHRLRWEISPLQPIPAPSGIAIRSITTSAVTLPNVPLLLDAPELDWAAIGSTSTGAGTMTSLTTGTHDSVDALGLAGNGLVVSLTGPGTLSFWMKAANSFSGLRLDTLLAPVTQGSSATWFKYTFPIPQGKHTLTIYGNNSTAVDEFLFQPLPALSAEAAIDAPAGVTLGIPDADKIGAAAWAAFSHDGTDSLLLMPGQERRLTLQVPPMSTVTFRARAAFISPGGSPGLKIQDNPTQPMTTDWQIITFATTTESGLSTIYVNASNAPILLDRLSINTPSVDSQYFPWAALSGLSASQRDTASDPDLDGIPNFAEYAFGLKPTIPDSSLAGTDTVPGLPEVTSFTATTGQQFLEVRYWRRSMLLAVVETATQPSGTALLGDSAGWTTATNAPTNTNQPGGWIRSVGRSPASILPGTRQFARVRAYLP